MSFSWSDGLDDGHALIVGGTRKGKSGLLQLMCRSIIESCVEGLTGVDPHGSFVEPIAEWLANPLSGIGDRQVYLLDPASGNVFGLNPFATTDRSWEACHDRAQTFSSVIQAHFNQTAETTPLLTRMIYIGSMACARRGFTVVELLELLSLGGHTLRLAILDEYEHRITRRELEDLALIASKHPKRFEELTSSAHNRLLTMLGDPRLMRLLGNPRSLVPRILMDERAIVLVNLASMPHDAPFIGTLISSMWVADAMGREPMRCARHRLILDEAESMISMSTARLVDRCSKFGLNLVAAIQRMGQLEAKGAFVADSLLGNTALKVVFGGLPVRSARMMAETMWSGYLDLAEWKVGTERATVTGNELVSLKNKSRSETETLMRSRTTSQSSTHSVARGVTESSGHGTSTARATGSSHGDAMSTDGSNWWWSQTPVGIQLGSIFNLPSDVVVSDGTSETLTEGSSEFQSTSYSEVVGDAETFGSSESEGWSESIGRTRGEAEAYVTRYAHLPTSMYSLEEQLHRKTGEIMNLPKRYCLVKIEGQPPVMTRTAELTPAFKTDELRTAITPLFEARAATLAGLESKEQVEASIEERWRGLTQRPTSDVLEEGHIAPRPRRAIAPQKKD